MKSYARRRDLTQDAQVIRAQLRDEIIRVGWSETARRSGVDRIALHRAFRLKPATRSSNFATIAAVAQALGLEFTVRRKAL